MYAVALINGFCMMSVEMIASKVLAPYFGHSMNMWGSIISVFMLSLAVGAMIGGWLSSRWHHPKIVVYMLCVLVLSLVITLQIDDTLLAFMASTSMNKNIKMIISCCVLFAPFSLVSGMIAPFSIGILSKYGNSGLNAGRLYFASTLASSIGVILTSFYLVTILSIESIFILNIGMITSTIIIIGIFKLKRIGVSLEGLTP